MTDRRRPENFNVWHQGDEVVLDLFGPGHDPATVVRDDADCGVVFSEQHAEWLANHLRSVLGEIRAVRQEHEA